MGWKLQDMPLRDEKKVTNGFVPSSLLVLIGVMLRQMFLFLSFHSYFLSFDIVYTM
jgi:hypothetical protein